MKELNDKLKTIPFGIRFLAVAIFCVLVQISSFSKAADVNPITKSTYMDLQISISGQGQDLIFIHGLNSKASVFNDMCAVLSASYRCHLIQLPGFAGAKPIADIEAGYLPVMAEQVANYIKNNKLNNPVLVGHSLGGFLSLLIASQDTTLVKRLVLIDSLPFFGAAQNPAATVEMMRPMATAMKQSLLTMSDEVYKQRAPMQLMGMTRNSDRMPTLIEWSISSDRATMAQSMYEMQTTDLRDAIASIDIPVLVFGSWAAYENYGTTQASAQQMFEMQYRNLPNKTVLISDASYHFIMWDDQQWLLEHMTSFLK